MKAINMEIKNNAQNQSSKELLLRKNKIGSSLRQTNQKKAMTHTNTIRGFKDVITEYNEVLRSIREYLKKYIPENWKNG